MTAKRTSAKTKAEKSDTANGGRGSDYQQLFRLFTEIGIINQLSVTEFNRCMPDNLHVSHFSVLNHLVRLGDGKTPKQITAAFQVTKGTMTNTLNDLSRRGLIKLEPHETDGRSKVVFITKAGRSFQKKAIESLTPTFTEILQQFDASKIMDGLPMLQQLREVLDERRSNDTP